VKEKGALPQRNMGCQVKNNSGIKTLRTKLPFHKRQHERCWYAGHEEDTLFMQTAMIPHVILK